MMLRDKKQPLYMISVVSEMLHVHPQTSTVYERERRRTPKRTKRQRLYSEEDVERLGMIVRLTRELGVNKAGVEVILRLTHRIEGMHREMEEMMNFLEENIRKDFAERLNRIFTE